MSQLVYPYLCRYRQTRRSTTYGIVMIKWDNELSIGIDVIDLEHRMMVMLLRKLDIAVKSKASKSSLMRTLDELIEFTQFHFASEENLMREIYYPELLAHERVHSHLLSRLHVVAGRINHDRDDPSEAISYLWAWFGSHVLQADLPIGKHLQLRPQPSLTERAFADIFLGGMPATPQAVDDD